MELLEKFGYTIAGAILTVLFQYVKGLIEKKEDKIEAMNEQKLSTLIEDQKSFKQEVLQAIKGQGKKTRKQINGLGQRHDTTLENHEERISEVERQLVTIK